MWCSKFQNQEHTWTFQHPYDQFSLCSHSVTFIWLICLQSPVISSGITSYFQRNYLYYIYALFFSKFLVNKKCLNKNSSLFRSSCCCIELRFRSFFRWGGFMCMSGLEYVSAYLGSMIWCWRVWRHMHFQCTGNSICESPNCRQRLHISRGETG